MKESDFYEEVAERTKKYLLSYLGSHYQVTASIGSKALGEMIREIEASLRGKTVFHNQYIPPIELDILIGVKNPSGIIKLCLVEVKYDANLRLAHYSQLLGYLHVAKQISIGLLFLVEQKPSGLVSLSQDFRDIINMKYLPMRWELLMEHLNAQYQYNVGICSLTPGNGIQWVDSKQIAGISSCEELSNVFR